MAGIDSNKVYLPEPDQTKTTGAVGIGKVGTAKAPTDARAKLDATWADSVGYVGEDGISIKGLVAAGDAIRDWAKKRIRTTSGDADPSISLPAIQVDEAMARMLVGTANVTVTPATATSGKVINIAFDGKPGPNNALCFSMKDENRRVRVYVPSAQVTDLDDVEFVPDSANQFAMTLSLNADETGHYVYFIYDDGVVTGA
ncbi:hypothetical protein [Olsenella profusa]|uniref:Major tail protein n=1 Tax=Olsenella profusa F0195 TaxID=1125712 RepID=U2TPJ8_9ACTN|nr:hypothetical protein [Olsenella profusa]ERL08048.1 hypothetical protein HMPREF1316_2364 [Olsenella profusa F0195]